MAKVTGLKMRPVKYYHDILNKLDWQKVEGTEDYYAIVYNGVLIADIFKGKTGFWYAILDRCVVRGKKLRNIGMIVAGIALNRKT